MNKEILEFVTYLISKLSGYLGIKGCMNPAYSTVILYLHMMFSILSVRVIL